MELDWTIQPGGAAESLINKLVLMLNNDSGGRQWYMIPPQQLATDHNSGNVFVPRLPFSLTPHLTSACSNANTNSFFIRSRSNHCLFWYYSEKDNSIQLHEGRGTPFKIHMAPSTNNNGRVMIQRDPITISVLTVTDSDNGHALSAGDDGFLRVGPKADTFLFGDLQGSFLSPSAVDRRIAKVNVGQPFELVQ